MLYKVFVICAMCAIATAQRGHYAGSLKPIVGSRYQTQDNNAAQGQQTFASPAQAAPAQASPIAQQAVPVAQQAVRPLQQTNQQQITQNNRVDAYPQQIQNGQFGGFGNYPQDNFGGFNGGHGGFDGGYNGYNGFSGFYGR